MNAIKYKSKEEAIAAFKRALDKKRAWMEAAEQEFAARNTQTAL